nr:hypothetical protein [Methylomarinum sp. Ch1-1]MDP4519857.1 hypothetical protein [Methylomarinum sp. Ch1-1]
MVYNRYGYTLLALILIDIYCFKENKENYKDLLIVGASSGIAIAIALFLKASYFGAAIILTLFSLLSKNISRPYLLGIIASFTITTIFLLYFIQYDIIAILNDLKIAAGARSNSVFINIILIKILYNLPVIFFIILLGIKSHHAEPNKSYSLSFNIIYFCLVILFVDILIISSNQQYLTLPLSIIFSLLLYNNINTLPPPNKNKSPSYFSTIKLHLITPEIIFFLIFFGFDISGLSYGALQKSKDPETFSTKRFSESRISSLILFDNNTEPKTNGSLYTEYINDGIDLIKKNSKPNEKVLAMEMFNPFSYALGRQPAKGGIAAAAFNYTISDKYHPSENKFFGTSDILMVPKRPASPNIFYDGFYKIYQPSIKKSSSL